MGKCRARTGPIGGDCVKSGLNKRAGRGIIPDAVEALGSFIHGRASRSLSRRLGVLEHVISAALSRSAQIVLNDVIKLLIEDIFA